MITSSVRAKHLLDPPSHLASKAAATKKTDKCKTNIRIMFRFGKTDCPCDR